jgi:DUF4097 and DUF4098 domain-containing protein YvlB
MAATLHRAFEAPGQVVVRLVVPEGDLRIEARQAHRVEVEVDATRGRDGVDGMVVDATERGGVLEVLVEAPSGRLGRRRAFAISVTCPEGSSVEAKSASADLRARGRLGDVTVRNASGDVAVEDAGSLTVASASGDVAALEIKGTAVVKTTSGDVEARSVGGDLVASLVSGDVAIGSVVGECEVSTVSGDVRIDVLGGRGVINAVSGDVDLGIPPGRQLFLDVRSATGDVRSDLDVDGAPSSSDVTPTELTVRTVSGDVRIRRSSG